MSLSVLLTKEERVLAHENDRNLNNPPPTINLFGKNKHQGTQQGSSKTEEGYKPPIFVGHHVSENTENGNKKPVLDKSRITGIGGGSPPESKQSSGYTRRRSQFDLLALGLSKMLPGDKPANRRTGLEQDLL